MNEDIRQEGVMPSAVQSFINNVKSCENHGIYHMETYDMNGNKTGEAFGMNLVTNLGMNNILRNNYSWNRFYIFIGESDESAGVESNTIKQPFETSGGLDTDTTTLAYTPIYDKEKHILSRWIKVSYAYFDYNYNGKTTVSQIKEVGVGDAYNQLFSRALIYDKDGKKSYIEKRPNERLYITYYMGVCLNTKLIDQLWDKGVYMFYDPRTPLYNKGSFYICKYPETRSYNNYYRNHDNQTIPHSRFNTSGMNTINVETHEMTASTNYGSGTFDSQYDYVSCMMLFSENKSTRLNGANYDNGLYSTYWFTMTFDEYDDSVSTEDRTLTTYDAYTNSYGSNLFTNLFGLATYATLPESDSNRFIYPDGELPVVNFDITELKMYNHKSHEWDIDETFISDDKMDYNAVQWRIAGDFYVRINDKNITSYVFINIHPEWELVKFNNTGITLYATDEYWNTDEWILIENLNEVHSDARHKKYYIQTSGTFAALRPEFKEDAFTENGITEESDTNERTHYIKHRVVPKTDEYNIVPDIMEYGAYSNSINNRYFRPMSSDKKGWFCLCRKLVYSGDPANKDEWKGYDLGVYGDDSYIDDNSGNMVMRFNTDDRICIGTHYKSNGTNFPASHYGKLWRIYELKDKDTPPVPHDLELSKLSSTVNPFPSYTNKGYICVQSLSHNQCAIISIYGDDDTDQENVEILSSSDDTSENKPTYHMLTNVTRCFALNLTNNCVYRKMDAPSGVVTFEVYDMEQKQVIDTFNLPEGGSYTIHGIGGWKSFIYIRATRDGVITTYFYNYEDENKRVVDLETSWQAFNMNEASVRLRTDCSVDECYILSLGGYGSNYDDYTTIMIDAKEPTKIQTIVKNIYGTRWNRVSQYFGCLKYINDEKQLLYSTITDNGSRCVVLDVGYSLDNGPDKYDKVPYYNCINIESLMGTCFLYKDGLIIYTASDNNVNWYPIERFIHHKMTGTTRTINGYNNPFQISGKTYEFAFTNSMELVEQISDNTEESG